MTYHPAHFAHYTGRNCVRCGKALTDAASMEVGVGPICRKLDNALLAKMFDANIEVAQSAVKGFDLNEIAPEAHPTFAKVLAALTSPEASVTSDFRETVKRIEWVLSHGTSEGNREKLTSVVAALGYAGLAALWNGDAATGLATIWFAIGRLFVAGPRNKAARVALKSIQGVKGGAAKDAQGNEVKFAWSVPAAKSGEFFRAIVTHYPHNQGLLTAVSEAKAFQPEVAAPVVEAPAATLTVAGEVVKLKTPYKPEFVAAIKALPYKERAWNPVEKVWEVRLSCRTAAESIVAAHFGKFATVQAQA